MRYSLIVDVFDSQTYLPQEHHCFPFLQVVFVPQIVKKSPALQVFQNHVDVLIVVKDTVELDNVRMSQKRMNLYLLDDLGLHLVLPDCLLA